MARIKKETGKGESPASPNVLVASAIIAVIAGAAGAGFAFLFLAPKHSVAAEQPPNDPVSNSAKMPARANRFPADALELALDPIITSIGHDARTKMRLEASLIVTKEALALPSLKKELTEDIVTFLNGVTVEEISGMRGFQNLREDLDDRAKIRGRGNVLGLLISGFVVE